MLIFAVTKKTRPYLLFYLKRLKQKEFYEGKLYKSHKHSNSNTRNIIISLTPFSLKIIFLQIFVFDECI